MRAVGTVDSGKFVEKHRPPNPNITPHEWTGETQHLLSPHGARPLMSKVKSQASFPSPRERQGPAPRRVSVGSRRYTLVNSSLNCTKLGRNFCLKKKSQLFLQRKKEIKCSISRLLVYTISQDHLLSLALLPTLSQLPLLHPRIQLCSAPRTHSVPTSQETGACHEVPEEGQDDMDCHRPLDAKTFLQAVRATVVRRCLDGS